MKIGCITELECMCALIKFGYIVSIPYGDCAKYDLIADINGKLTKIQVKKSSELQNSLGFKFTTDLNKYKNEVDAFMTSFNNEIYFIPIKDIKSKEQKLWFTRPNINQEVLYASEYLIRYRLENKNQ